MFLITGVMLFSQTILHAQSSKEQYYQAEDLMEDGNFNRALSIYQELLKEDPNNANLNFKVGFCYLNTATEKTNSVSYLEFAAKSTSSEYQAYDFSEKNAPIEALFYLGKAYHVNYRFDDAERTFLELKRKLSSDDEEFIMRINHELAACQVARVLIKSPVEMTVSNLGKRINTEYSEHSPVISGDESMLIFTSKRKGTTGGARMDDGQYFEDIYISSFNGKNYSLAKKISENINTPGHEASIGLSFDATKLFIYRDDDRDGNIYVSNRKGAEWGVPEPLPSNVNSKYRETHASMSFDQNEIFFTSDRKGGFGGLDIYRIRKLPNGRWSRAQNLGPEINTSYDEEGPYIHPDGITLFFSSNGHNTMGGFDIFVSYKDNDSWSTPENIGYPINTPDDNVYYVPSVDGRRAYYSSYTNNSIGNYDIFRIDLAESHVRNQTVIAGFATSQSGELLQDAIITISDMDDELIGIYTPDTETGKFLIILPRGKTFKTLVESSNYPPREFLLAVPEHAYDQSKQVVVFNEIVQPIFDEKLAEQSTNELAIKQEDRAELTIDTVRSLRKISSKELLVANELNAGAEMKSLATESDINGGSDDRMQDEVQGSDEQNSIQENETEPSAKNEVNNENENYRDIASRRLGEPDKLDNNNYLEYGVLALFILTLIVLVLRRKRRG